MDTNSAIGRHLLGIGGSGGSSGQPSGQHPLASDSAGGESQPSALDAHDPIASLSSSTAQEEVEIGSLPFSVIGDSELDGEYFAAFSSISLQSQASRKSLMLAALPAENSVEVVDPNTNTPGTSPFVRHAYQLVIGLGEHVRKAFAGVKAISETSIFCDNTIFSRWQPLIKKLATNSQSHNTNYKFRKSHFCLLSFFYSEPLSCPEFLPLNDESKSLLGAFKPEYKERPPINWACNQMFKADWQTCTDKNLTSIISQCEDNDVPAMWFLYVLFRSVRSSKTKHDPNAPLRLIAHAYPDLIAFAVHQFVHSSLCRDLVRSFS